jgi:predicted DNA-binding protein (MmcQ/YjbR family)
MARSKKDNGSALERLREFGLRYPGAHTKSPWPGHLDLAVNDKTFAYLSIAGEPPKISCKLPRSADAALGLPFTTPTAYGLGKSGWVTATFPDDASVPVEMLEEWIDESYRAQAPKRLSAKAPAHGAGGSAQSPSTVKQVVPRAATAAAPASSTGRRATSRAAKPAPRVSAPRVSAPRGSARGARAELKPPPTRAGKRARVSPGAAKRRPKKRA